MNQEKLQKTVKRYIKEEERILAKYKLGRAPMILFKQKKVPMMCRVAIWILQKHKAIIDWQFFQKKD